MIDPEDSLPPTRPILRRVALVAVALVTTLSIAGQAMYLFSANTRAQSTVSPYSLRGTLTHKVDVLLTVALGKSDRGVRRFDLVQVRRDGHSRSKYDIVVRWAINDALSEGTVGNGAQADAFEIFRSIYSARLPIASVGLVGTYPLGGSSRSDSTAMKLTMDRNTSALIAKATWDSLGPTGVWPLVQRIYVAPDLTPMNTE